MINLLLGLCPLILHQSLDKALWTAVGAGQGCTSTHKKYSSAAFKYQSYFDESSIYAFMQYDSAIPENEGPPMQNCY